jgi:hypothetical protein
MKHFASNSYVMPELFEGVVAFIMVIMVARVSFSSAQFKFMQVYMFAINYFVTY